VALIAGTLRKTGGARRKTLEKVFALPEIIKKKRKARDVELRDRPTEQSVNYWVYPFIYS